ncbi:MAG TPA: adenine deaminase C-terminal domain-containing protein, partial [Humisphaera sp.]
MVFARGRLVATDGELTDAGWLDAASPAATAEAASLGRCDVAWDAIRWQIPAKSARVRVIGHVPDQLVTRPLVLPAKVEAGHAVADVSRDLLKMAVVERHRRTGNVGLGFIQGFGLTRGAIAGTVAHDHHNLVVIGADDLSMQAAARAAAGTGGGLAVAVGERVVARLPLPVGGLMTDRPVREAAVGYAAVVAAAKELGSTLADPFMAMSFMALEVIPVLKLTDRGLVDVEKFEIVELCV